MLACGHEGPGTVRTCGHVRSGGAHIERFTGHGIEQELVCKSCAEPTELVCAACEQAIRARGADGFTGTPGIIDEPSSLQLEHLPPITPRVGALRDLQPLPGGDRDLWIGVTAELDLVELDLDRDEVRILARLPARLGEVGEHEGVDERTPRDPPPLTIHVSRDATLAAVVQEGHGIAGVVIDLASGAHLMPLCRDSYHPEHCTHSCAFIEHAGRTLLVHASDWNRLDIHDPRTGTLLTPRGPTSYSEDRERPDHYLDYFHCGLAVSPDQRWIVDNGWVWQPVGVVVAWRIDHWLEGNVWESEDGPSRKTLCWRNEWDMPMCWLDNTRVAVWGYGEEQSSIPAVQIFDIETGALVRWFAGPTGELVFDRVLISLASDGATVWDVERGTRLLIAPGASPTRFHPTARTLLRWEGSTIHRARLIGLDAGYRTGAIATLADRIAAEHAFEDLPVLGDALEAAGCSDREMLAHCQHPGEHAERCWVLDRLRRV